MELIITPRRSGTFLRTIENLKRHNLSETTGIVTSQLTINQIKDKSGLILINHEDFIAGNYDKEKIKQMYVFEIPNLLNKISEPPVIRAFITASVIID